MPVKCQIKSKARLVVFSHEGTVSDDEFISAYKGYHEDPGFDKSYNILVDLRLADSGTRSSSALRTVAEFRHQWMGDSEARPKVAVIAPRDLSFGLARMYENYSNDLDAHFVVFRAVDAAQAWLGVPEIILDVDK